MKTGQTIKRLRFERGMSIKGLSRLSGVHISTISRIEHGKIKGSLGNYEGLAKGFGLKLSELFAEVEKE